MRFNPPQARRRSRRQMKKLRIGEFRELGFSVSTELKRVLTADEQEAFLIALLDELIEPRGLSYGGGVDVAYIAKAHRGSATDEDRQAAQAWFSARPEVKAVSVAALEDCWHDGPQYVLPKA